MPVILDDNMEEIRIDMRKLTPEEQAQGVREVQLCFKLNNTMPFTKEYDDLVHEIFGEFGEGSRLMAPTSVAVSYTHLTLPTICSV